MSTMVYRKELIPKVIEYFKKNKIATKGMIAKEFGISKFTAETILSYLLGKGIIEKRYTYREAVYIYIGE